MRVYVCGGQDYVETKRIFQQLDSLNIDVVYATESKRGCTLLVKAWAEMNDIPVVFVDKPPKMQTPEDRELFYEQIRKIDPDLVVVFPGHGVIDEYIKHLIQNPRPHLIVEDEDWKKRHSLKMTDEEKKIVNEILSWRGTQDKEIEERLISLYQITPEWFERFKGFTSGGAVYSALTLVRKGGIEGWKELAAIAEDRSYLARKGCSPIKAISSRENGKKGGRPRKVE